jgi:hypothetical protein
MADPTIHDVLAAVAGLREATAVEGASLRTDMVSLRADIASLQAGVGSLREDTNGLRIDIMGRMDRLQDTLTIQRDELVVNYGAAERAERLARAAQDEVRVLGEMVTPMVRQIRRLQEEVRILRGDT